MNLNHLRAFASVANHGSFTRAARALHVSQPAISKQLGDLEQDLGTTLVDRLPRGVRLTAAGEVLFAHAQRILSSEQAAESELRDLTQLAGGRLSIGASTTLGSYFVPSVLGELHRMYPRVQLSLRIANTALIQEAVLENRLDLGLTEGFVASPALSVETLAADELIAIAAPGHPALARAPLPAVALLSLPFLMREPGSGSRDVVEASLRALGLTVEPIMSLGSTEALKNAVLHGLGIAIVSRLTVEHELSSGRLAELKLTDLTIRRDLHLVSLRGKRRSPAATAFIELVHRRERRDPLPIRGDVYAI
jgi:DNA-binding transcriptional LysR family regulator